MLNERYNNSQRKSNTSNLTNTDRKPSSSSISNTNSSHYMGSSFAESPAKSKSKKNFHDSVRLPSRQSKLIKEESPTTVNQGHRATVILNFNVNENYI